MTHSEPTQRTRLFRGRQCTISRSTRNVATGVIYDHLEYKRMVTNRRDNSTQEVTLTRKLRRAGTDAAFGAKEVEVEVADDDAETTVLP